MNPFRKLFTAFNIRKCSDLNKQPDESLDKKNNIHKIDPLELHIAEIMMEIVDAKYLDINSSVEQMRQFILSSPPDRILLCAKSIDNIEGFLHLKDLCALAYGNAHDINSFCRKPVIVPGSMTALTCLKKMNENNVDMAIIVDEHNCADGIFVAGDIIHAVSELGYRKSAQFHIHKLDENKFAVDGRMPIEQVSEIIELGPINSGCDTIGGLITSTIDRIPETGEFIIINKNITAEIKQSTPRRIDRVILHVEKNK